MIKCAECGMEFENNLKLGLHIKVHGLSSQQYYDKYLGTPKNCLTCGKPTKYIKMGIGYRDYCCGKCATSSKSVQEKAKKTYKERTGYEHNSMNPESIERAKETNKKKYGVDHIFQTKEFIEQNSIRQIENSSIRIKKMKLTCIDRYGVDNASKSELVKEKIKETNIRLYGVDNAMKNPEISKKSRDIAHIHIDDTIKKIRNTKHKNIMEKYSKYLGDYTINSYDTKTSIFSLTCPQNHTFDIQSQMVRLRHNSGETVCVKCNPYKVYDGFENSVIDYIKSIYTGSVLQRVMKLVDGYQADIFIPEKNIVIECNGLYWHGEYRLPYEYHMNKTDKFEKEGYKIIHIWEDDWRYKTNIIKSRLMNILNLNKNVVYARECVIGDISSKDFSKFMEDNHLQGSVNSGYRYGLYHNKELVSVMSFGPSRFEKNIIELHRFSNKIGYTVTGGASKLFKYAIEKNNWSSVVSYADRCWSSGNLYKQLGFDFVSNTIPNYYWVGKNIRENRFKYRKSVLVSEGYDKSKSESEIMHERKFYRVYDCGNSKWIWTRYSN